MRIIAFVFALVFVATSAFGQKTQIPPVIKTQVAGINDQFSSVLEEECPRGTCYPVGCEVSRFTTLDEQQTSSLPGLETSEDPSIGLQYKLESVRCEFTYEPKMDENLLPNLRQRILQRVKPVGVSINLVARKLLPKDPEEGSNANAKQQVQKPLVDYREIGLWGAMIPFIPWLLTAIIAVALVLLVLWGVRSLGKSEAQIVAEAKLAEVAQGTALAAQFEPSSHMILTRVSQLRADFESDPQLVEQVLKFYFDTEDYSELAQFIKHFGPGFLQVFRTKTEYREVLNNLSKKFNEMDRNDPPGQVWKFLDKLERGLTAAKIRIDQETLEDEFAFLSSLTVEELANLLKEVPESEAVSAIAYAPRELRERFFAVVHPTFTAKFIEQLTQVDKLPDSFVREAARKLRKIYNEKSTELRTVSIDRLPLLEQALNTLEVEKRREVVTDIEKENPDFFQSLVPRIFFDDSLLAMPENVLTEAFLIVTPEEASSYLQSFPKGQEVFGKLPTKLKDSIKKYFQPNKKGNTRLALNARNKIGEFIKEKDSAGEINLRNINSKIFG